MFSIVLTTVKKSNLVYMGHIIFFLTNLIKRNTSLFIVSDTNFTVIEAR